MTKDTLLQSLVNEYKDKLRQDSDITVSDFRKAFQKETGLPMGDRKARKILNLEVTAGRMTFLTVLDPHKNQDVQVWRPVAPKTNKKVKQ